MVSNVFALAPPLPSSPRGRDNGFPTPPPYPPPPREGGGESEDNYDPFPALKGGDNLVGL